MPSDDDLELLHVFALRGEPYSIDDPAERDMLGRYRDAVESAALKLTKRSLAVSAFNSARQKSTDNADSV